MSFATRIAAYAVIDLRKLAAIDIVFLGPKFVCAEYAAGVLLSLGLGVLVLFRSSSRWGVVLGIYLICLAVNYAPMLSWAVSIRNKRKAQAELGGELSELRRAMAKYRRQSLLLLVPGLPLAVVAIQERSRTTRP